MYRTSADGQRVVWSGVGDPHEPTNKDVLDDAGFELIVKKKCCTTSEGGIWTLVRACPRCLGGAPTQEEL
jgi:hypothetical protein